MHSILLKIQGKYRQVFLGKKEGSFSAGCYGHSGYTENVEFTEGFEHCEKENSFDLPIMLKDAGLWGTGSAWQGIQQRGE